MKIGCDVDGCLADFNTAYIALIANLTGKQLPQPSDTYPECWGYTKTAGVTLEEESKVWNWILTSGFWSRLDPLPGAQRALEELRWSENEVYFITARPGVAAKAQTERWLERHGYDMPTVLISASKGPIAQGLALDVFIDDRPENCADVLCAPGYQNTRVFLVDAPYNRAWTPGVDGRTAERVKSVSEALERIR